jgi:hypothetical protein
VLRAEKVAIVPQNPSRLPSKNAINQTREFPEKNHFKFVRSFNFSRRSVRKMFLNLSGFNVA